MTFLLGQIAFVPYAFSAIELRTLRPENVGDE